MAIDVLAAFECEPPVLDFIWPGFLAGTVGALVAPGATGKSFWGELRVMGLFPDDRNEPMVAGALQG